MSRRFSPRFQPRLEALEDRYAPSAAPHSPAPPPTAAAVVAVQPDQQVPFKEHLTVVAVSPTGVISYAGNATHLGRVTAVYDPADGSFTKTAANGDMTFGYVTPASDVNGTITITGGTGRSQGATGLSAYVISTDSHGTITVDITGVISYGHQAQQGAAVQKAGTQTVPLKINGGGLAPLGIPLFPGGTAPHDATGQASHLGRYTGNEGMFELLSLDLASGTGTFRGSFVFVAANGDRLAMNYGADPSNPGTFTIIPAGDGLVTVQFVAVFTPDPSRSTGRFADVIGGSLLMIANTEPFAPIPNEQGYTPPFAYTWAGEGTLVYGKGK